MHRANMMRSSMMSLRKVTVNALSSSSAIRPAVLLCDSCNSKLTSHQQRRNYGVTKRTDSALIIGGLGIVIAAAGAQYGIDIYTKFTEQRAAAAADAKTGGTTDSTKNENAEESPFAFMNTWFAKNFYDGGFEEKMSKREAALILGVRESATLERIKDAHRKILIINHPDKGGSAYLGAKINEAKDLLMKGKS